MSINHTYAEIANDYRLWADYVDTDATMTEEEFDAMSEDEKVQMQESIWGPESK